MMLKKLDKSLFKILALLKIKHSENKEKLIVWSIKIQN